MMHISVVNRSQSIADLDLQRVVRAINRQIAQDFEPCWGFGGRLRVEGPSGRRIDLASLIEMRGDAVIYIVNSAATDDALGYHDANLRGIPYGFVFLDLCAQLGDSWTSTLSHEALELIGDPMANLLVQGPHPNDPSGKEKVFHYFEMCDAVQAEDYEIDAVTVSNFVLPAYFSTEGSEATRRDFAGSGLRSFSINPGGYIGFYDPETRKDDTYMPDRRAQERYRIKMQSGTPFDQRPAGRVMRRSRGASGDAQASDTAAAYAASRATHAAGVAQQPSAAAPSAGVIDPIRHVVVLMLENRSFDHMLGGLASLVPGLDGVDPQAPGSNDDPLTGKAIVQQPIAKAFVSKDFMLPHEFVDVTAQIDEGAMSQFVASFANAAQDPDPADREQVMAYFADGALPVLHTLAKNYLVCTRWFSSLPGPTWPNRFFVHSGTSRGLADMPSADDPGSIGQVFGRLTQDTIYDRIDEARNAGRDIDWRIYHDGLPQSIILDHLKKPFFSNHYAHIDRLEQDAQFESSFPSYAFIEPRYFGADANDQHPPASVLPGEALIARVYNAIRANPELWHSTLLIVTYDEHGGFYDPVPPPATIAPDGYRSPQGFAFDKLGVRVPTILVSPFVTKGCDRESYDHTSILRYLIDKWGLRPLGARSDRAVAGAAKSFADSILPAARPDSELPMTVGADAPVAVRGTLAAAIDEAPADLPVDNAQRLLLAIAEQMRRAIDRGGIGPAIDPDPVSIPPDIDPRTFNQRVAEVDRWLAAKGKGPDGDR
ncbi:MAG: alkaline phosphatase family protein [Burkholderiaceae bacterium]